MGQGSLPHCSLCTLGLKVAHGIQGDETPILSQVSFMSVISQLISYNWSQSATPHCASVWG